MKKISFILILLGLVSNVFASKYICYRYVDGQPTGGFVKIYTDSQSKAEKKALEKYKDLGYTVNYVKCELSF